MKINVSLYIADQLGKEDVIEIEDQKLEELTEDEVESAIEIKVRSWVDRNIKVTWDADTSSQQ